MSELKLEEVTHVLKAYKYYLAQLTHCAFDEATAQWILDNWDADYDAVEKKGSRQGVTL